MTIFDVLQLRNLRAALPALPGPLWARGAGSPGVQPPGVPVSAAPACCTRPWYMLLLLCCMSDACALFTASKAAHHVCRMMFKLLRCTCLHCFHLKLEQTLLARYRQRLALLLQVAESLLSI